jgi:hypothetical protein
MESLHWEKRLTGWKVPVSVQTRCIAIGGDENAVAESRPPAGNDKTYAGPRVGFYGPGPEVAWVRV